MVVDVLYVRLIGASPLSSDIDECADGFVECDSKSTCVNLPGWYHCECRDGYHDNGLFSASGESCVGEWPSNKYNKLRVKQFISVSFSCF